MSDVIAEVAASGPLTALLSLGFSAKLADAHGTVYGRRLGTAGSAASQHRDDSWCIKRPSDPVDASQTTHVTSSSHTSPQACKATICSIWKKCSEHSSSIPKEWLEQMLEVPSITVDREKLLGVLRAPWCNWDRLLAAKKWPVELVPLDGQLCVVGRSKHHEFVPIIDGDWPTRFTMNGLADIAANLIASANASRTVRLLLTGTGVHVGGWEIGGSLVEKYRE